jgi:hypothetical protein
MYRMHTLVQVCLAVLSFLPAAAAEFRAGAATSNITPELGSSINGGFQDGKAPSSMMNCTHAALRLMMAKRSSFSSSRTVA